MSIQNSPESGLNGNGTTTDDQYALELRAEVFNTISAASEVRRGQLDRLETGSGSGRNGSNDIVAGTESVVVGGDLIETVGRERTNNLSNLTTTVHGRMSLEAHAESFLMTGTFNETHHGGELLVAGMSDDLIGGIGVRTTAPADLWLNGLIGMEEKLATANNDVLMMDVYAVGMEREFGTSIHNMAVSSIGGQVYTTQATGFMQLHKIQRGLRNTVPGSAAGDSSSSKPPGETPPPSDGGATSAVAGQAAGGSQAAAGGARSVVNADALEDLENIRHVGAASDNIEDSRQATEAAESAGEAHHAAGAAGGAEGVEEVHQLSEVTEQVDDLENLRHVDDAANADETAQAHRGSTLESLQNGSDEALQSIGRLGNQAEDADDVDEAFQSIDEFVGIGNSSESASPSPSPTRPTGRPNRPDGFAGEGDFSNVLTGTQRPGNKAGQQYTGNLPPGGPYTGADGRRFIVSEDGRTMYVLDSAGTGVGGDGAGLGDDFDDFAEPADSLASSGAGASWQSTPANADIDQNMLEAQLAEDMRPTGEAASPSPSPTRPTGRPNRPDGFAGEGEFSNVLTGTQRPGNKAGQQYTGNLAPGGPYTGPDGRRFMVSEDGRTMYMLDSAGTSTAGDGAGLGDDFDDFAEPADSLASSHTSADIDPDFDPDILEAELAEGGGFRGGGGRASDAKVGDSVVNMGALTDHLDMNKLIQDMQAKRAAVAQNAKPWEMAQVAYKQDAYDFILDALSKGEDPTASMRAKTDQFLAGTTEADFLAGDAWTAVYRDFTKTTSDMAKQSAEEAAAAAANTATAATAAQNAATVGEDVANAGEDAVTVGEDAITAGEDVVSAEEEIYGTVDFSKKRLERLLDSSSDGAPPLPARSQDSFILADGSDIRMGMLDIETQMLRMADPGILDATRSDAVLSSGVLNLESAQVVADGASAQKIVVDDSGVASVSGGSSFSHVNEAAMEDLQNLAEAPSSPVRLSADGDGTLIVIPNSQQPLAPLDPKPQLGSNGASWADGAADAASDVAATAAAHGDSAADAAGDAANKPTNLSDFGFESSLDSSDISWFDSPGSLDSPSASAVPAPDDAIPPPAAVVDKYAQYDFDEMWMFLTYSRELGDRYAQQGSQWGAAPRAFNYGAYNSMKRVTHQLDNDMVDLLRKYLSPQEMEDLRRSINPQNPDKAFGVSTRMHTTNVTLTSVGVANTTSTAANFADEFKEAILRSRTEYIRIMNAQTDGTIKAAMQDDLADFDIAAKTAIGQAFEQSNEMLQWSGAPLRPHIDRKALADALSQRLTELDALVENGSGDIDEMSMISARAGLYSDALTEVMAGFDPIPKLAEHVEHSGLNVAVGTSLAMENHRAIFDNSRYILNQVSGWLDSEEFWTSAPVYNQTGGFLDHAYDMRLKRMDDYTDTRHADAATVLLEGEQRIMEVASMRMADTFEMYGLPVPQATNITEVRGKLLELRDAFLRMPYPETATLDTLNIDNAWQVQRVVDQLDNDLITLIDEHLKYADQLANTPARPLAETANAQQILDDLNRWFNETMEEARDKMKSRRSDYEVGWEGDYVIFMDDIRLTLDTSIIPDNIALTYGVPTTAAMRRWDDAAYAYARASLYRAMIEAVQNGEDPYHIIESQVALAKASGKTNREILLLEVMSANVLLSVQRASGTEQAAWQAVRGDVLEIMGVPYSSTSAPAVADAGLGNRKAVSDWAGELDISNSLRQQPTHDVTNIVNSVPGAQATAVVHNMDFVGLDELTHAGGPGDELHDASRLSDMDVNYPQGNVPASTARKESVDTAELATDPPASVLGDTETSHAADAAEQVEEAQPDLLFAQMEDPLKNVEEDPLQAPLDFAAAVRMLNEPVNGNTTMRLSTADTAVDAVADTTTAAPATPTSPATTPTTTPTTTAAEPPPKPYRKRTRPIAPPVEIVEPVSNVTEVIPPPRPPKIRNVEKNYTAHVLHYLAQAGEVINNGAREGVTLRTFDDVRAMNLENELGGWRLLSQMRYMLLGKQSYKFTDFDIRLIRLMMYRTVFPGAAADFGESFRTWFDDLLAADELAEAIFYEDELAMIEWNQAHPRPIAPEVPPTAAIPVTVPNLQMPTAPVDDLAPVADDAANAAEEAVSVADDVANAGEEAASTGDEAATNAANARVRTYGEGLTTTLDQMNELVQRRIDELRQADPNDPRLAEAMAEFEARQFARDEVAAGRDPRPGLTQKIEELTNAHGADDYRVEAYSAQLDYLKGSSIFADEGSGTQNLINVDFKDLRDTWRARADDFERAEMRLPHSNAAEIERAETFSDLSGFIRQAYALLSAGRDPRPELQRHAMKLQSTLHLDGFAGDGEASVLLTMVREYDAYASGVL